MSYRRLLYNCTWSKRGTFCRPIQNICDLPEYSHGTVSICLWMIFICSMERPVLKRVIAITGPAVTAVYTAEKFLEETFLGHDDCYELNRGANRFGHCTTMHRVLKFNGCKKEDVKYGRLQCSNITQLPPLQEEVSFHQPKISGVWCWGLSNHYRLDVIVDVGQIRNGALLRRSVLTTAAILVSNDCPPNKCNFRRLCNNYGECFCHIGWKPPMC